jgi:hypothetical protein
MRRWCPVLVSILALVAATSAAATSQSEPRLRPVNAHFKLTLANGLRASLGTSGQEVTLAFSRRRQFATYSVRGRVSPDGDVSARFGSLGQISVEFEADTEAHDPCLEAIVGRPGTFVGTIAFTGEGGYVRLRAGRARGRAYIPTVPKGCGSRPSPPGPPPDESDEEQQAEEADTATLAVDGLRKRRSLLAVGARSADFSYTYFFAGTDERRGAMHVSRGIVKSARSPTFVFDSALTTATVRPPKPFQGDGAFQRNADGSTAWSGTVTAPFLGAGRLVVAGPGSTATMVRDVPGE